MSTSARSAAQPAFGLRLPPRYRVRRHVATGGMASVWCAEDRVLGRQVAIKILSERFAHDEVAVRRFKREARAAARVSGHPHVVTIFDVGDIEPTEGEPSPAAFIVMEFLAGGTVADALRCQAVGRPEALRWLREAASALDHAHGRGIVHRDIKPANFLLDQSRGLHVADFGIASLQSEDTITSTGVLFGTAAYLAPEQALGHEATSASDRYALAVAAFELLTGSRPFTASHFAAQARQHIEDEPPSASEREPTLPPGVDGVLAMGLAKDPAERYPTAGAFVESLQGSLDGEETPTAETRALSRPRPRPAAIAPVPAAATPSVAPNTTRVPPGAVQRGSLSSGRSPGRAAALAALLVVVIGVVVLVTQLGSSSHPKGSAAATSTHRPKTTPAHRHRPAPATQQSSSTTTSSSPSVTAPPSPSGLELAGHQQMLDGDYSAAVATLRQALASASPASLTYAYALYDLGRSLLLAGDPKAAIPVLEQRLRIPNQTPVVQALLNRARQAAGEAVPKPTPPSPGTGTGSGGAGLPPGFEHGNGHHHEGGGGD